MRQYTWAATHREIFWKSYYIKPKSDCIYHFRIDLKNGIHNLISVWFNKIFKIFLCVYCPVNSVKWFKWGWWTKGPIPHGCFLRRSLFELLMPDWLKLRTPSRRNLIKHLNGISFLCKYQKHTCIHIYIYICVRWQQIIIKTSFIKCAMGLRTFDVTCLNICIYI